MENGSKNIFDKNINSFSPEGRLYQVEYALRGSNLLGATCIATKGLNTICLIEEKEKNNLQSLSEVDSLSIQLNSFLGCVCSGIPGDLGYLMSEIIREFCNFFEKNGFEMTVEQLANSISLKNQVLTQQSFTRLLGVKVIFFGIDRETGPCIVKLDPSGHLSNHSICAIGRGCENFKAYTQKNNPSSEIKYYDYEKTITYTISLLNHVLQNDLKAINLKITIISEKKAFQVLTLKEIDFFLEKLKKINQIVEPDNQ